ncbi:phytanoyl-CoA dioxygenase family protein [Terracidiphilus gabretensis]|jgi:ectoine hydroxylase-related dioxygenase (phytanoyl-CoA dioxygenase family)|uniref:phytanoyl-CoA dioxygenase family protein n=1 Tax=Terracidiphilus gabretensis TaxID=1577687 RepID=UPI00071BD6B1|nr:phytanoyl-CoA dioxygenase family protein [Terracidiphilus gabretensis]
MKSFRAILAGDLDSVSLKSEMETYGYVFIRDLMPKEVLEQLLNDMIGIASDEGWMIEGSAPSDRLANSAMACFDPDPKYKQAANRAFCLERLHALKHHPVLTDVMKRLVGPRLLVHPKPIARIIFPNCEAALLHAHQDNSGIAGSSESYTAWMPMHDCLLGQGTLEIKEASHLSGLQCTDGYIKPEAAPGGDWVGGRINAGDVAIFHSLTVHRSTLSTSNQLRCSVDCRFQSYDEAVSPLEIVFPNRAKGGRTWETTYADWKHDDLKYYWRDLPLRIKPSLAELAEKAENADSPEKRLRYTTTMELIEREIPMLVH